MSGIRLQAIDLLRRNASVWNIDASRIGLVGFSAGGHLAATAGTRFEQPVIDSWRGALSTMTRFEWLRSRVAH